MEFRKWKREDFSQMIDLGEKMYKEGAYKNLSYNKNKLKMMADKLIDKPKTSMGFVAEENNEIIGMMIVILRNYFFSDDIFIFPPPY